MSLQSCENDARRRSSRRGGGLGPAMAEEDGGPALRVKVKQLAAFVGESKYAVVYVAVILPSSFQCYRIDILFGL